MGELGQERVIRMAVISDSHARPGAGVTTHQRTWVQTGDSDPHSNPLEALVHLLERREDLRADVLLFAGDLCDQAEWAALDYVWRQIGRLGSALRAEVSVATAGNHDIDSHARHAPREIAAALRELSPPFPIGQAGAAAAYWSERVSVVSGPGWQVVTLNSTLMRALDPAAGERDHGEISRATLETIRQQIGGRSQEVNVLLCHHHPLPSTHLDPEDRSQMELGDQLVRLLDELPGQWFVVHGHKHEPSLDYLGGSGDAPVRLAAGSVGAMLRGKYATHVRNQFHLIEFPIDRCARIHLSLGGWVRSWTWRGMTGWEPALDGDGLPALAGFGHKRDGRSLARQIFAWGQQRNLAALERGALLEIEAKLEFMLPRDLDALTRELEQLGAHPQMDRVGNLDRVVMPT